MRMPIILTLCALLLLGACSRVKVEGPEGFAKQRTRGEYRALSPEGMLFRVRTVKNYPRKDLIFWKQALRRHLTDEGYHLLDEGEAFSTDRHEGIMYEWAVPYAENDYIFLTALVPMGGRIIIVEAAGEHSLYALHRRSMRKSLETISRRF